MAFNPNQYKIKKKRAVDPNAPPRPNLMSHDKKLRENQTLVDEMQSRIIKQADEIDSLKSKFRDLQQSMAQLINYVRRIK
jgi:predicted transcriptional regulator